MSQNTIKIAEEAGDIPLGANNPAFSKPPLKIRANMAPVLKGVKRLVPTLPEASAQRPDIDTITPAPT